MCRNLVPSVFVVALVVGQLHAQSSANKPTGKAGEIVLEKATAQPAGGTALEFELGTLYARENRSEPKSRLIGVGFARFKAKPPSDAPPIFLLPGGPGTSFLKWLKPG